MKLYVKVTDVQWDTDGEEVELPTELIVEVPRVLILEDDYEDEISEYVSDKITDDVGFCHFGFKIEGE